MGKFAMGQSVPRTEDPRLLTGRGRYIDDVSMMYGRNLEGWVRRSRDAGHEVMLEVPLEPFDYPDNDPGPHTLLTSLPPEENIKRLHWIMSRFTGYTGITNQMGAKFAAAQDSFLPVLEEVKSRGLLYLDDGTAVFCFRVHGPPDRIRAIMSAFSTAPMDGSP